MDKSRRNFLIASSSVVLATGSSGILIGIEIEKIKVGNANQKALETLKAKYSNYDLRSLAEACDSLLSRMEHINKLILNIKNTEEDDIATFLFKFILNAATVNGLLTKGITASPNGNIHKDTLSRFKYEIVMPSIMITVDPSEGIEELPDLTPLAPLPKTPSNVTPYRSLPILTV